MGNRNNQLLRDHLLKGHGHKLAGLVLPLMFLCGCNAVPMTALPPVPRTAGAMNAAPHDVGDLPARAKKVMAAVAALPSNHYEERYRIARGGLQDFDDEIQGALKITSIVLAATKGISELPHNAFITSKALEQIASGSIPTNEMATINAIWELERACARAAELPIGTDTVWENSRYKFLLTGMQAIAQHGSPTDSAKAKQTLDKVKATGTPFAGLKALTLGYRQILDF